VPPFTESLILAGILPETLGSLNDIVERLVIGETLCERAKLVNCTLQGRVAVE